jgi:benzoate/toluate 1,2-dioxygenase reductase subunit
MRPLTLKISARRWLSSHTVEIRFRRPEGFAFLPGQKIRFVHQGTERDYTLINAPADPELAICVRHVPQGRFSPLLVKAQLGTKFKTVGPFGFFIYQSDTRTAVFVATGTGVAPFVAFARAGVRHFCLLHGVRRAEELYYAQELAQCAKLYRPCLSGETPGPGSQPQVFAGRVTACLDKNLATGDYDFYLCGRSDMIAEAVGIIDSRFPQARVFAETFY